MRAWNDRSRWPTMTGVLPCEAARSRGLDWEREERLVRAGILDRPAAGVTRATAAPETWRQRVRIVALAPGDGVISHGAAARLHRLDGFGRYDAVDALCRRGWWPDCPPDTITHFTRRLADRQQDVELVHGIRTLTVPATLTLLAPSAGLGATAQGFRTPRRPPDRRPPVGRDAMVQTWSTGTTHSAHVARRT